MTIRWDLSFLQNENFFKNLKATNRGNINTYNP